MKTIIVHPNDPTTTFLHEVYKDLPNKTVISGGITKSELRKYIEKHPRVIMCGHGSPSGLFGVGQFPTENGYIFDESMVESMRHKANALYIWCNADKFVQHHSLMGFHTGMFISELSESQYYGFWKVKQETIDKSNHAFVAIVARYINEPMDVLYKSVIMEYGELSKDNAIAAFNHKRLYLSQRRPDINFNQLYQTLSK